MIGFTASGLAATSVEVTPGQDNLVNSSFNRSLENSIIGDFNFTNNSSGLFVSTNKSTDIGVQNLNVSLLNDGDNTTKDFLNLDLDVQPYTEWSFNKEEIVRNASVLSGGSVNLSVDAQGNTADTLTLNTSGNLSEVGFTVQSPVTVVPDESLTVANGFSVPRNKEFGWYNGTIEGSGAGFNDSVNVSIRVFDDIKPEITDSSFPDVMALQEQTFSVEASDNLEVANVTGNVTYETIEEVGNETVIVTEELVSMNFTESISETNLWEYTIVDTDRKGNYSYFVRAVDESGNSVNVSGSFQVNRLDSISVLQNDFEFKDVRPRTDDAPERQVEEEVFRKEFEKDLKLELTDFSHRKNNSSMTVGIKNQDSDNIQFLYRDGENQGNVTVTDRGVYSLVVFSDSKGDTYSGDLQLYPVAQHREIDSLIRFSGVVVDPEYPALPETRSIGDFEGEMEFILNSNDVPVGIRFTGENRDIEDCKGVDSWSNCIPGYTLGELPEAREQVEKWRKQASDAVFWRNVFMLIGIAFPFFSVYNRFSQGTFMQEPRIPKQFVGQEVNDLNDVKISRRDAAKSNGGVLS